MSGFFITGTDTEVGKTFVSSLLIKILAEENFQVVGMKPVASGAKNINGALKNEDALSLIAASNVDVDYKIVNQYVFEEAVSPHIAAEQANIEINLSEIKKKFDQLKKISDMVVVEGVGGWYAPLNSHATVADVAKKLNLPVILVVGLRLGCLSHALLTAQAIKQSGVAVAGWIANYVDEDFSYAEKNVLTLKNSFKEFPFLGSVFYQSNYDNQIQQHTIDINFLAKNLY